MMRDRKTVGNAGDVIRRTIKRKHEEGKKKNVWHVGEAMEQNVK